MFGKFIIVLVCLIQISKGVPAKTEKSEHDLKSYFSPNIVGGEYAPYGHSKHMVALMIDGTLKVFVCGGSILTKKLVLTAAHCIEPFVIWDVLLPTYVGVVGTNYWNSTDKKTTFTGYMNHPGWQSDITKNDIGFLFPTEDIQFGDLVGPIALNYDWISDGQPCYVTGWGRVGTWLNVPDRLKILNVNTISTKECFESIEDAAKVTGWAPPHEPNIEICTYHSVGQGLCNGDSGSALVLKELGQQIGVVSWGFPCAIGGPDVYARISGYKDFLEQIIKKYTFPVEEEQDMSIFFDRDFIDSTDRIVGGNQAGHVAYMVALTTGSTIRRLHCGGSIVNPNAVMTAAHCMVTVGGNNPFSSLRGVVGTNRWNSGGAWFTFQRGIMHPAFDDNTFKNDIGILVPANAIALSASVQRVVLNFNFAGAGLAARVTGWGRTSLGGSGSATLLEIRPTVIDGLRCVTEVRDRAAELSFRVPAVDPNLEVCTLLAPGRGTCHGDSGGPLVRADNSQQIGIVAWGLPCARGAPDMFTRISAFRAWIQNNT